MLTDDEWDRTRLVIIILSMITVFALSLCAPRVTDDGKNHGIFRPEPERRVLRSRIVVDDPASVWK